MIFVGEHVLYLVVGKTVPSVLLGYPFHGGQPLLCIANHHQEFGTLGQVKQQEKGHHARQNVYAAQYTPWSQRQVAHQLHLKINEIRAQEKRGPSWAGDHGEAAEHVHVSNGTH